MKTQERDELFRGLSPERRALFEDVRRLREQIGPIEFDVVEAIRELRLERAEGKALESEEVEYGRCPKCGEQLIPYLHECDCGWKAHEEDDK